MNDDKAPNRVSTASTTGDVPSTGNLAGSAGESENWQAVLEKLSRLEKVVRGVGRDSLSAARGQRETEITLQTVLSRLDDLELAAKGLSQATWRVAQDSQGHLEKAEQHFAGALRELEQRVREEIRWQIYRNVFQAIVPTLDDLDLVIGNQQALADKPDGPDGEEDLLEAVSMIRRRLAEGLRMLGLEEIPIKEGITQFDPNLHEVVDSDIPAELLEDEGLAAGMIVRVRRAGYRLDGRVFRVPQVLIKT